MINSDRMIFCNIAWMREYKGNWLVDKPINGGSFIKKYGWGGEVYNFQAFNGAMYGYVEPGVVEKGGRQRNINISRLITRPGALRDVDSIGGVLVVWVATPKDGDNPEVVGWYEEATLYRSAQIPPVESGRTLPPPHVGPGEYFAVADIKNCQLVKPSQRTCKLPGKGRGFGRSNLWYAESAIGIQTKNIVLRYIQNYG